MADLFTEARTYVTPEQAHRLRMFLACEKYITEGLQRDAEQERETRDRRLNPSQSSWLTKLKRPANDGHLHA